MDSRSLSDLCEKIFPMNWLTMPCVFWLVSCCRGRSNVEKKKSLVRSVSVMHIYNPLSQQEEDRIDKRFAEAVDML